MPKKKSSDNSESKKMEEKEKKIEGKEEGKEKEEKAEKESLLVPVEEYMKAAVHFGTRAVTPYMRQFVYKRRGDGIAILNTKKIDERIEIAASFLSRYEPKDIIVCCKRDAGHKALEAFHKALGVKIFKRYFPGIITNPTLENFLEPKCLFIVDPWADKNALHDAIKIRIPIVALCNTNNSTANIDLVVPCNNKTAKSIGLVLYLIAKLYLEKRGEKKQLDPKEFYVEEETELKKLKEK